MDKATYRLADGSTQFVAARVIDAGGSLSRSERPVPVKAAHRKERAR
ncbi:hypothetical protein [Streptomyces sp. NPDC058193]